MSSYKKHFTRQAAEVGAKMVVLDENGKPTEDWILVRGQDSETFNKATTRLARKTQEFITGSKDPEVARRSPEFNDLVESEMENMKVALFKGWSFEETCDEVHIKELLQEAPLISEQVDAFAKKRSNFGRKEQPSS